MASLKKRNIRRLMKTNKRRRRNMKGGEMTYEQFKSKVYPLVVLALTGGTFIGLMPETAQQLGSAGTSTVNFIVSLSVYICSLLQLPIAAGSDVISLVASFTRFAGNVGVYAIKTIILNLVTFAINNPGVTGMVATGVGVYQNRRAIESGITNINEQLHAIDIALQGTNPSITHPIGNIGNLLCDIVTYIGFQFYKLSDISINTLINSLIGITTNIFCAEIQRVEQCDTTVNQENVVLNTFINTASSLSGSDTPSATADIEEAAKEAIQNMPHQLEVNDVEFVVKPISDALRMDVQSSLMRASNAISRQDDIRQTVGRDVQLVDQLLQNPRFVSAFATENTSSKNPIHRTTSFSPSNNGKIMGTSAKRFERSSTISKPYGGKNKSHRRHKNKSNKIKKSRKSRKYRK